MKIQNHLKITGFIASDVSVGPDEAYANFNIIHPGNANLFLHCFAQDKGLQEILSLRPKKGDEVFLTAFLRNHKNGICAVIQSVRKN